MSSLTTERRRRIPAVEFGLPASRKYPMPDRRHAANAKARASQQVARGKLSPVARQEIDAKANRVLARPK